MISEEQFVEAYERGQHMVLAILSKRRVKRPEDLAQQAWLNAWKGRHSFRGDNGAQFLSWVGAVTKNVFLDSLRKTKDEPLEDAMLRKQIVIDDPSVRLDAAKLISLTNKYGPLMTDFYLKGMSETQLAAKYGCSRTAIRIRMIRGRREIREMVFK